MTTWEYEKLDENFQIKQCPINDTDGSVTGHIVFGVKKWFDENPEEARRKGWIKHIHPDRKEVEYNKQTQFIMVSTKNIDDWTITDEYHVVDKSEEMLAMEEMLEAMGIWFPDDEGFVWQIG